MRKSLYFRNFVFTASLVLVSFLIIGLSFVFLARSFLISERQESLSSEADEVVRYAVAFSSQGNVDSWDLRLISSVVSRITSHHIFITDTDGTVASCSDMELVCEHLGKVIPASVLHTVNTTGEYSQLTTLGGFYSKTYYVVAKPIAVQSSQAPIGYVFVGSDSTTLMSAWGAFMSVYFAVAVVIMLLTMMISFIASKQQARPLNQMVRAAHSFAHGDFSVRVEDEGREDELGELTGAFNAMADALEKSEQRRREFVANISHELKTPMTTIAGFADGILDGTIPPESQDKYLETISSETKRLNRLVRRMLELSQIQSQGAETLRKKSFDINEVLARTLINFEQKITAKGLDVDVQLPEEPIQVLGDMDSITQVVYNLLENAIKFAPEKTTIGLSLWRQSGKAFVSVKNQGETIPPEELALIFDRFHKTDKSRSQDRDGVGLGLYIVKTILNDHDEDITVSSRDGVTEFVFSLTLKNGK